MKAGKLAPPPTLIDILRAASILADAKAASAAQDPAPPPVAPDTPQAPALAEIPVPPANAPAPSAANGAGGYFDDGFTAQLFSLVNQRRQAAGLRPLAVDPRLANSAATYTKVLAGNDWFSHTGPDGSTLVTRDEAAGFPFTVQLGEVLAWGSDGWTAAEIVQAWIDSPAHRDQVLSSAYTRGGAGCYFTNTGNTTVRCAMELAG